MAIIDFSEARRIGQGAPYKMSDNGLAVRAAWPNVSSATADRLISQMQKAGLVGVFIEGVPAECAKLEEFILHRFGLASCTKAPFLDDAAFCNEVTREKLMSKI